MPSAAHPLVLAILVLTAASCEGGGEGGGRDGEADSKLANLTLELSLGEDIDAAPEYQFSRLTRLLVLPDGTLWVLDGTDDDPLIRIFDSAGRFHREVGRVGGGPGEFRNPRALARLPDGRVLLRDRSVPDRLTLYTPGGEFDTIWHLPGWGTRGGGDVRVDTGGGVWVGFMGWRRPGPNRPPLVYQRVRADGTLMDTVRPPEPPEVRYDNSGFDVPYLPRGGRVWGPFGAFAVYRTDQYRIELVPPIGREGQEPDTTGSTPSSVISREVPPVSVHPAERAAIRNRLEQETAGVEGGAGLRIPDIAEFKPPIESVAFGEDGRLWVGVSLPSVLREGEWTEPKAYDVFEPDGRYKGRVPVPGTFYLYEMRGDQIWGVFRGEFGEESIRRYRIRWR